MKDKLTDAERSHVEHLRQEFLMIQHSGVTCLSIIDRLAPRPPKLSLVPTRPKEPK